MATIIKTENSIWHYLSLPAVLWQTMLRTDFGSSYLGKTYKDVLIVPLLAFAEPFIGHSVATRVYCGIALVKALREFLKSQHGKQKILIHGDSTGLPVRLWYRLKFFKSPATVKTYGEPGLALLIGLLFYRTGWDEFFGKLMFFTAGVSFYMQWEFKNAGGKELTTVKNGMIQAQNAQELQQKVADDMQKAKAEQNGGQGKDGFAEVH